MTRHPGRLTVAQFEALRALDSPTVANAIEAFNVRPLCEGYAGFDLRCAFPNLGTMMGYAVTCTAEKTPVSPSMSSCATGSVNAIIWAPPCESRPPG